MGRFFGAKVSTKRTRDDLTKSVRGYQHHDIDTREAAAVMGLFKQHRGLVVEAIEFCEEISVGKLNLAYDQTNRIGDHIWWISNMRKFQSHYPGWKFRYGLREILNVICAAVKR